ncbi:hypothetical protein COCON_G00181080 [Conger conger]|uniref:Uncharacterized protein n=1 Tax=Conger conger TaxID=82655 RepID=A0A9Q1D5K4_CONCO|nr:hypothetical protein COCON_G00181080 [Conger conger]
MILRIYYAGHGCRGRDGGAWRDKQLGGRASRSTGGEQPATSAAVSSLLPPAVSQARWVQSVPLASSRTYELQRAVRRDVQVPGAFRWS